MSLLEVVISLAVVSVIISAVWILFSTGIGVSFDQMRRSKAKGEAAQWVSRLGLELRQADSVSSALTAGLTFTADTDKDGVDETIQYTWSGVSGQALNRIEGTVTAPMVNSVSNLALVFFDANNTQLSFPVTASQVRLVSVDLTVTDNDEIFNLRNRVRLSSLS